LRELKLKVSKEKSDLSLEFGGKESIRFKYSRTRRKKEKEEEFIRQSGEVGEKEKGDPSHRKRYEKTKKKKKKKKRKREGAFHIQFCQERVKEILTDSKGGRDG